MSGIQKEVTNRPASTEEDGVWAWVFRECEDCDGEWMGLCVVMNRCAAVEGGAEGGGGGKEEREGVGEEVVDEEELEVGCACVCCGDCGFGAVDYWNCVVFTTKSLLRSSFVPFFGY